MKLNVKVVIEATPSKAVINANTSLEVAASKPDSVTSIVTVVSPV